MDICDAHMHYGNPVVMKEITDNSPLRGKFPCYTTVQYDKMGNYEALIQKAGFKKVSLIPSVFVEHDRKEENDRLLDFASKNRCVNSFVLLSGDLDYLEARRQQITGVKEHFVRHESILTEEKKAVFSLMQDYGLILLLHSQSSARIPYVTSILKNFPRLKIQIAHMGRDITGSPQFIIEIIQALKGYETVYYDTSTVRISSVIEEAVDLIGPDRILFGSDFPFYMDNTGQEDIIQEQINHVLRAKVSQGIKEKIFAGNYCEFVG